MNKRQLILKIFNEAEWLPDLQGRNHRTITSEELNKAGLSGRMEPYRDNYNDVVYAKRIFKKMGHRVIISSIGVNVYEREN